MKNISLITALILATCLPLLSADLPVFLSGARGEVSVVFKMANPSNDNFNPSVVAKTSPFAQKHSIIISGLKNRSGNAHKDILSFINANQQDVSEFKSYWISNVIYVKGNAAFIRQLAARPDVEEIIENLPLMLVAPVDSGLAAESQSGAEPGLDVIGAHTAWSMGLTGNGSIVCNFDTGVKGNHPALINRWRGNNGGTVSSSWFDPYTNTTFPTDNNGHGTHTMGTMLGQNGADTVGVAFGAQWIAAAVVDRGGGIQRTIADILSAFEWAADPDGNPATSDDMPDVVNNSWGIPSGYMGACDDTFWDAIDNLEALGVVCLFAAGNEGPNPRTIRTPADRIQTQFNSFAVGAISSTNMQVASFSSRGPSGCDSLTIKPEIVAPGVSIRSCDLSAGYRTMSGTSMATPYVAGAVALLRQFNPQASVDEIKNALILGANDLGSVGPDNAYGNGCLNILRSLYNMPPPNHPFVHVISTAVRDNQNNQAEPGETIQLAINVENIGSAGNISGHLHSSSINVVINQANVSFGQLSHLDSNSVVAFSVSINSNLNGNQSIPFTIDFGDGVWSQSYSFVIVVANTNTPAVATLATDQLQMSFSNFGQFGLGNNSLNPSGGVGFCYPAAGSDFLREASLMISVGGNVSDGARNSSNLPDNDFRPLTNGAPQVLSPGSYSDHDGYAAYSDSAAENPLGVSVSQRSFAWDGQYKFVNVEFTIRNITSAEIRGLRAGLYCDWDLPSSSGNDDVIGYDEILSLGYIQNASTGWCAGIRPLSATASSYRAVNNSVDFAAGFSESQKVQYMNEGFVRTDYTTPANYAQIVSIGPYNILAGDSIVVSFAFVVGESLDEIRVQADQSFWINPGLTDFDSDKDRLPNSTGLAQNYPNPFNNNTVIEIKATRPTEMVIYDVTGRLVKSFTIKQAGTTKVIWDGHNERGESVSSGMYLYRLTNSERNDIRKMILLK